MSIISGKAGDRIKIGTAVYIGADNKVFPGVGERGTLAFVADKDYFKGEPIQFDPDQLVRISKPLTLRCICRDITNHRSGTPHPIAGSALLVDVSPVDQITHDLHYAFPPIFKKN